jgi:transcriptional regulator with GAF, ATPase, and Fis domain
MQHSQPLSQGRAPQLPALGFVASRLQRGESVWFSRADDVPDRVDSDSLRRLGLRSAAIVPLSLAAEACGIRGGLAFSSSTAEREWTPALIEQLRLVSGILAQALARQADLAALQKAHDELRQLRQRLTDDDQRPARRPLRVLPVIVAESAAVKRALEQVERVAATPATVLLLGETGVGKEVFARAIHELSTRRRRQMIRVSCAALPNTLIESELFGYERGAYTGADTRHIGRFEAAHGSTLLLDEIGELSMETQVKLLRVLQERAIERLGSTEPIRVDVRIIAATNRNLEKAIEDKSFREDLFYRLNVFPIVIPPLRERVADIRGLAWTFVDEIAQSMGKPIDSISRDSMRQLQSYPWPGNVRELRNVIERAVILARGPRLTISMPECGIVTRPPTSLTLRQLEIEHISSTLESSNWRVRGPGGAAERLGLKPTTLESRMAKLGIARPTPERD